MKAQKLLAIAAGSGRIGYVFFVGNCLQYWHLSHAASCSPGDAAKHAKVWIEEMQPDVIVTEAFTKSTRKGEQAKANMETIVHAVEDRRLMHVAVARKYSFSNKYAEADALAERFPELLRWVPPPRRLWDPEPKNLTIFEALVLALEVIDP